MNITDEQLENTKEIDLLAVSCQESFEFFVRRFFDCIPGVGTLVWNWHLSLFCEELEYLARRVHRGEQKTHDLVVNVPFGTTKSSIISILFQCWVWSWWPEARFLCGTHTDSLALNLAQRAKDVIECERYRACFPNVLIRTEVSAKEDYANTVGGERKSCTVGGKTPMGRHSHFCILDDPLDPQGVYSQAIIDTAARFITEVIPSRVVDKGVVPIVLVMQRLHPRDPSAVMLAVGKIEGGTPVRHICLPGELGGGALPPSPPLDELRAKWPEAYVDDDLLDAKRLSRRVLNDLRNKLSRFAYGGQVLQNPVLPGGGMFEEKYFQQRVKAAPYESQRIRFWDRAATKDGGCYTAGVLMCVDSESYFYTEDVVHGQWGPRERNLKILATARRDRARYGPKYEPMIVIEGERGSTGEESYAHLARMLSGFRVREDLPSGSKDTRAEPWSDQLAAGNVYIVDNGESMGTGRALWDVQGYIEEHILFRPETGKRVGGIVDRVDASSGAFNILSGRKQVQGVFRVLPSRDKQKKGTLRIVVCADYELGSAIIEERALLICIRDPEVRPDGVRNGLVELQKPEHNLARLVDSLTLQFADIAPSEYQDRWEEPLDPWGVPPERLIMTSVEGKKLWSFITRKRDIPPEVIVIVDERREVMSHARQDIPARSVLPMSELSAEVDSPGELAPLTGRRALSLGYAVADTLRLSRQSTVHVLSDPEGNRDGKAPNEHVYNITKVSRNSVM